MDSLSEDITQEESQALAITIQHFNGSLNTLQKYSGLMDFPNKTNAIITLYANFNTSSFSNCFEDLYLFGFNKILMYEAYM